VKFPRATRQPWRSLRSSSSPRRGSRIRAGYSPRPGSRARPPRRVSRARSSKTTIPCRCPARPVLPDRPNGQGKLVRCVKGAIYDVAVDARHASPTYGRYVGAEISAENWTQIWGPVGFVHAYCKLTEESTVIYTPTLREPKKTSCESVWLRFCSLHDPRRLPRPRLA
jgi:hypothetical protein